MKLLVEAPLNRLSLGNVSYNIIRELQKRGVEIGIFPIGNTDLDAYDPPEEFKAYLQNAVNRRFDFLSPEIPCLKIWHLNGSENRKNKRQYLLTFYECNRPTVIEAKLAQAQDITFFCSSEARNRFEDVGVETADFAPLGFDEDFGVTNKPYLSDTIHFGLMGKFEHRKHTAKIIKTWAAKYGNDNKYQLTCCVNNPFFNEEQMKGVISNTLGGQHYKNINFLPHLQKNSEVNELLNAIDIDLTGLSGGEGWNLPAFNATCIGKWSVVLNATSHKDWATPENSILVEPSGEMSVVDGVFFNEGADFNQGTFYTWTEEEALQAMAKAESKVGEINTEGQKLSERFTYSNTVDIMLSKIFEN